VLLACNGLHGQRPRKLTRDSGEPDRRASFGVVRTCTPRHWPALLVGLLVLAASPVRADTSEPAVAEGQPQYGVMPMASKGSDRRLERRLSLQGRPKYDRRNTGPSGVLAISGGIPIFVGSDVDRNIVKPGGSFAFLGGVDFGYGVFELDVGYMGVPIEPPGRPREPLQRVHLGFGGRLQVPNASRVIPYISAGFAAQWWKLDTRTGCSVFACSTGDGFRFAPGLTFRGGVAISLCRSTALDIGLGYNLSFQGNNVFTQTRHWIEPTVGFRFWL